MENLVAMCLNVCQQFAEKSQKCSLTEYEALLYEQCARTAKYYLKSIENSFRIGLIDQEKELDKKLEEGENGEATSNDKK